MSWFCECFAEWDNGDGVGAFPKWLTIEGASPDGRLMIDCPFHGMRWIG
jgi:hypothetical protein